VLVDVVNERMSAKLSLQSIILSINYTFAVAEQIDRSKDDAISSLGVLRGVTRDPGRLFVLADAQVMLQRVDSGIRRSVVSGNDGNFLVEETSSQGGMR
jgi:hypothetical protein